MEMMNQFTIAVGVLLVVVIIALIANIVMANSKIEKAKLGKISFKETMDLVDLPIVTFIGSSGKKLNFLLDTGANYSSIHRDYLEGLNYQETGISSTSYGSSGFNEEEPYIVTTIKHRDKYYTDVFQVSDLSIPFGAIKAESGVELHGILGNIFFQKFKYILDFDELIAYTV